MRNHFLPGLMVLAALLEACAPFSINTVPTYTPLATAIASATPSFLPSVASSPTLSISPTAAETASPTPTILRPTTTTTPSSPPFWQPVIGISVGGKYTFSSCAGSTPLRFNGTITTNDSTVVVFDWLLRNKTTSYTSPSQKVKIKAPGTYTAVSPSWYNAKCGRYSLSLNITYPNPMMTTVYLTIP